MFIATLLKDMTCVCVCVFKVVVRLNQKNYKFCNMVLTQDHLHGSRGNLLALHVLV